VGHKPSRVWPSVSRGRPRLFHEGLASPSCPGGSLFCTHLFPSGVSFCTSPVTRAPAGLHRCPFRSYRAESRHFGLADVVPRVTWPFALFLWGFLQVPPPDVPLWRTTSFARVLRAYLRAADLCWCVHSMAACYAPKTCSAALPVLLIRSPFRVIFFSPPSLDASCGAAALFHT